MAIRDAAIPTQDALLAVARLVAAEVPEQAVFDAVCEQLAAVTGAPATSVLRYVGDERAVALASWREGGARGVPVNAELDFDDTNSALGRARATRRPARADSYEGVAGPLPEVMRAIGLRATVAAPVMLGDEPWGALVASTTGDEPLPDGAEHGLVAFAELVAQAVVNAERRRESAAARVRLVEAADAARRRLERALHEGAQQHVVALALKLRVALEDALADATATSAALRALSRSLHPAVLDERGLAPTLLALAARAPVPLHLRELPGRRFPAVAETTVYLLVDETLAQAAGGGATELGVRVADRGDRLLVRLDHDGTPRDAAPELADRVAALGGTLESRDGVVTATLPLG
jgi:GAF domain-containing protein